MLMLIYTFYEIIGDACIQDSIIFVGHYVFKSALFHFHNVPLRLPRHLHPAIAGYVPRNDEVHSLIEIKFVYMRKSTL
jgi:hypothetical protein